MAGLESKRIFFIRVWDSWDFTRLFGLIKYIFQKVKFSRIKKCS